MVSNPVRSIGAASRHVRLEGGVTWTDIEGKVWRIEDMGDNHIDNCMRFMLRNKEGWKTRVERQGWSALMMLRGEMAIDQVERDLERLEDMSAFRVVIESPEFRAFWLERRHRLGLGPLPLSSRPEWVAEHPPHIHYAVCADCGERFGYMV